MKYPFRVSPLTVLGLAFLASGGCATVSDEHGSDQRTDAAHAPTASVEPSNAIGVTMDMDALRDVAIHNPHAAVALLLFHPNHWQPWRNLLSGSMLAQKQATLQTVQLLIERGFSQDLEDTMTVLSEGEFIKVEWSGADLSDNVLEVRIRTGVGTQIDSVVPSHPDIVALIDKRNAHVLSLSVGGTVPTYEPVPPVGAMNALRAYLVGLITFDYDAAARLVHAEFGSRMAPDGDVGGALKQYAASLPMWYELAEPHSYVADRHRLVLVPARQVVKGFPTNVRSKLIFAIASDNDGRTWGIVDNGCLNFRWAQRLFPGFDEAEFARVSNAPFTAVQTVSVIEPAQ